MIWQPNELAPFTLPDIVNDLVFEVTAYTLHVFMCYKSLEAVDEVSRGWVQSQIHKSASSKAQS